MKENHQRIKLLKLIELLRQETDELHPLSTNEICNRLSTMGISRERRTLAKDIALLKEQGFEVMWCRVGKEKGYYVEDRTRIKRNGTRAVPYSPSKERRFIQSFLRKRQEVNLYGPGSTVFRERSANEIFICGKLC